MVTADSEPGPAPLNVVPLPLPGATPSHADAPLLVGRERELARVAQALETASRGTGLIILLTGEPGIGKSRLADVALGMARNAGFLALRARSLEGDWQPPYGIWRHLIERVLREVGLFGGQGPDPVQPTLPPVRGFGSRRKPADLPDWAIPLLALFPTAVDQSHRGLSLASLSPDQERFRLADAVVQCLRHLTRRSPLILLIDDVQWADAESLRMLRHVGQSIGGYPLVLLVVARSDADAVPELASTVSTLRRVDGAESIRLRGLNTSEIGLLVSRLIGGQVGPPTIEAITVGSRGNPLFVHEMTRNLRESGRLGPVGEGEEPGEASDLSAGSLPASMRQVVEDRLDRLSEGTGRMLRLAAVCTGGFDSVVLAALTGMGDDALLDAIDEALDGGLIVPVSDGDERYDFGHALIRTALYATWSPSRRLRLHRQLAESLERIHAGRTAPHAAEIAFHYHIARSLPGAERGVPHALDAARNATRSAAPEQAATNLRLAMDLMGPLPVSERAAIASDLAIAEAEAIWPAAALTSTDRALALHEQAGTDPAVVARFLATMVTSLHDAGAATEHWLPLVHRGLALVPVEDEVTWARLTLLIPRWEPVATGAVNGARWLGSDARAVAIARASGDERLFARSLQPWDLWEPDFTDVIMDRIQSWQDPEAIVRALIICGAEWLYLRGDFARAVGHFRYLLSVSERFGSLVGQAEALVRLAMTHVARGEIADGRTMAERADAIVARFGARHRLHASRWWMTALLADVGHGAWGPVADYFVGYTGDPMTARRTTGIDDAGLASLALVRAGRDDDARALLDPLVDVIRRSAPGLWLLNGAVCFGGAAIWSLREARHAAVMRDAARSVLAMGHGDFPGGSIHLTEARMSVLLGDGAAARAAFAAARTNLDRSGQRPLRAQVDIEEADWLRSSGGDPGEAARLTAAARTAFGALGMPGRLPTPDDPASGPARSLPRRLPGLPGGLSEREVDVVRLVVNGLADRQIADALFLSPRTVHAHLRNIFVKTETANRTGLSVWAVRHGIVPDGAVDHRPARPGTTRP